MISNSAINWQIPASPAVCPTCHHCPTCGRTTWPPVWSTANPQWINTAGANNTWTAATTGTATTPTLLT